MASGVIPDDYYERLGVAPDASPEVIKRAHRKLAKDLHPDGEGRSQDEDKAEADYLNRRFAAIQEAYDVLGIPARRRTYDKNRVPRPSVSPSAIDWNLENLATPPTPTVVRLSNLGAPRAGVPEIEPGEGAFWEIGAADWIDDGPEIADLVFVPVGLERLSAGMHEDIVTFVLDGEKTSLRISIVVSKSVAHRPSSPGATTAAPPPPRPPWGPRPPAPPSRPSSRSTPDYWPLVGIYFGVQFLVGLLLLLAGAFPDDSYLNPLVILIPGSLVLAGLHVWLASSTGMAEEAMRAVLALAVAVMAAVLIAAANLTLPDTSSAAGDDSSSSRSTVAPNNVSRADPSGEIAQGAEFSAAPASHGFSATLGRGWTIRVRVSTGVSEFGSEQKYPTGATSGARMKITRSSPTRGVIRPFYETPIQDSVQRYEQRVSGTIAFPAVSPGTYELIVPGIGTLAVGEVTTDALGVLDRHDRGSARFLGDRADSEDTRLVVLRVRRTEAGTKVVFAATGPAPRGLPTVHTLCVTGGKHLTSSRTRRLHASHVDIAQYDVGSGSYAYNPTLVVLGTATFPVQYAAGERGRLFFDCDTKHGLPF